VPFPPFAITFSNADLKPQYGTNVEVGIYHRAVLVPEVLSVDVSAAAYHLSLRDELDFDLETFQYENIGKSRHDGLETGLSIRGPGSLALFGNYTLQSATSRVGENAGKYLKAIPRHVWTGGVTAGASTGPAGSLLVTTARKAYLDDANTRQLPAWTRWDARLSYALGGVRLGADIFNVLDRKYSTTGFPDVTDPSVVYYYPAAGRTLQIGLSHDW
jgi:outer membrane receptor protein involved in Fe transport